MKLSGTGPDPQHSLVYNHIWVEFELIIFKIHNHIWVGMMKPLETGQDPQHSSVYNHIWVDFIIVNLKTQLY